MSDALLKPGLTPPPPTSIPPCSLSLQYSWLRSGVVLSDAGSHWQLKRPDGTKLLEGAGTLPSGVASFIRGSLVLPSLVETSTWSVRLPNGTRLTGKGQIPDHIQRLFEQYSAGGVSGNGGAGATEYSKQQSR